MIVVVTPSVTMLIRFQLYMLQYLTPDILGFFAGLHNVYLIGLCRDSAL